ncbi:hypothetical protein ALC60_01490 [Trachymyrmex zeteki]|uniref:Uncharacterized protein n=1 Tax=Mycetomoellerius zeteki TaxID=64791 RepID=A0A151XGR4_9HYME|nr:hypothetical protein ALC60_01490 [Trachymyrmex zeteki]
MDFSLRSRTLSGLCFREAKISTVIPKLKDQHLYIRGTMLILATVHINEYSLKKRSNTECVL